MYFARLPCFFGKDNSVYAEEMVLFVKTAFIAIVGRPNVGKSRLLNALTGEKIAIVSNKPQTTRNRITGILTRGEDQFVFMDTPGLHKPKTKLGQYMVKTVKSTIGDVDAAFLVTEPTGRVGPAEEAIMQQLKNNGIPAVLVLNKTDIYNGKEIGDTILAYSAVFDFSAVVPVSAMKEKNMDVLLEEAKQFLHEGDWMFDADDVTDQPERKIASEMIREKILRTCHEEIPHGVAVDIEDFRETEKLLSVRATIYCERESHKMILIGHNGEQLKRIASYAREDMERFFDTKVYLNVWVKVKSNWRDSQESLHALGFDPNDLQ